MSDSPSPTASSEGSPLRPLHVQLPDPIVAWLEEQARARDVSVAALLTDILADRMQAADETGSSPNRERSTSSSGSIVDRLRSASERLQQMTRASPSRPPDAPRSADRKTESGPEPPASNSDASDRDDADGESADSPSMFDLLDD
jgi:hypothetical protein